MTDIPWVSCRNHLTAERLYHCRGSSKGLTFLVISAGFSYHWAGAGTTHQQMLILNSLTSPPSFANTTLILLWLFNSSQIRTMAHKKHQFAEVCDSAREITPQDSYSLIKWFWDYSGTVNFGCQDPDSWINSSVNKDRISSVIHSDPQLGSACELRFEFSSMLYGRKTFVQNTFTYSIKAIPKWFNQNPDFWVH